MTRANHESISNESARESSARRPTMVASETTFAASDVGLLFAADVLDDLEDVRTRMFNRAGALARPLDKGGKDCADSSECALLSHIAESVKQLEREAELHLKREMRAHPLGEWVRSTVGVGEKQGARLLAAIGDPYWNDQTDAPRTVSQLWAYCGLHVIQSESGARSFLTRGDVQTGGHADQSRSGTHPRSVGVAPARKRGTKANWNATAKARAFLIAESCVKLTGSGNKPRSPYRDVYDAGREKYADAVHQVECRRCGPSGKPAQVGSPLSDGHKHARAMRLVMKTLLKDLWLAARDLHGSDDTQLEIEVAGRDAHCATDAQPSHGVAAPNSEVAA